MVLVAYRQVTTISLVRKRYQTGPVWRTLLRVRLGDMIHVLLDRRARGTLPY